MQDAVELFQQLGAQGSSSLASPECVRVSRFLLRLQSIGFGLGLRGRGVLLGLLLRFARGSKLSLAAGFLVSLLLSFRFRFRFCLGSSGFPLTLNALGILPLNRQRARVFRKLNRLPR